MPKLPAVDDYNPVQLNCDQNDPAPFPSYLSLETFDNAEYETREPSEWLAMGWVAGEGVRKPVPGRALLPTRDDLAQCEFLVCAVFKYFLKGYGFVYLI